MSWPVEIEALEDLLNFENDRISVRDAQRQLRTVREILGRLSSQSGIVLADEVGMGKTFVALGVATMAALSDRGRRPVVVMVPASLQEKWPRDFDVFRSRVFQNRKKDALRALRADSALEFFKLIDDNARKRPHIIFLKHGAFHVQNIDHWVRLALIKRAMHGMHLGERRSALPRFLASLLRTKSSYRDPRLFDKLLRTPSPEWLGVINDHYQFHANLQLDDDPVPEAVEKVLRSPDLDVAPLRECLRELPARESESIEDRLATARHAIDDVLKGVWASTLSQTKFRSPLLILDEAHHLKNPATRLASLFVTPEAKEDFGTIAGALEGAFERMMFLTATPFQLGHHELLNVIGRFQGIAWKTLQTRTRETFLAEVEGLRDLLDRAQHRASELDIRWKSLRREDVETQDGEPLTAEEWWRSAVKNPKSLPERVQAVLRAYDEARKVMKEAEQPLRKWVIRHLRDRQLPNTNAPRRVRHIGCAIAPNSREEGGLPVADESLLPFLLAARAQAVVARGRDQSGRATFAEGLASSYEAFLETRNRSEVDEDEAGQTSQSLIMNPYLDRLVGALPSQRAYARHPKIAALLDRILGLWSHGEKVVVFCHYQETGRALVRHLSSAIQRRLWSDASGRLRLGTEETQKAVLDFGARFDVEGGMRRPLEEALNKRLGPYEEQLRDQEREQIHDVIRRFVRSPLFVARYFDVTKRSGADVLQSAFARRDASGASLGGKIDAFLHFIMKRCDPSERAQYLDALNRVQPGIRGDLQGEADDDLSQLRGVEVMPNVRLANGLVRQETRQRLMLAFNTPFFPEVLVASSVLAEGVDLHLNCRFVIHHDLSWNPSTLEQRTGRVDRIGAKAEQVKKPIEVFLPYIGGTQDEKQYRVVMDRERWFHVLMGEKYETDEWSTERMVERVPLPMAAAEALAFDLSTKMKRSLV